MIFRRRRRINGVIINKPNIKRAKSVSPETLAQRAALAETFRKQEGLTWGPDGVVVEGEHRENPRR